MGMLVVQHNCGRGYESTIAALETSLSIGARIACLQEPFIGNRSISHSAFNFYWPGGLRNEARVLTAVKKELMSRIVVGNRTDLVDHPYFLALDIRDIDSRKNKPARRTRVVNSYDNRVGQGCTWEGSTPRNRRALEDILWDQVIRGRVLLLGDMNAHSPIWNSHCQIRKNSKPLEDLIEKFDFFINNEPGRTTRPASKGISIIDLAFSTTELGFLTLWEIPEEYPSLSDHELILLRWEDISYTLPDKEVAAPTGWDIQGLIDSPEKLQSAYRDWLSRSQARSLVGITSSQRDLDEEVGWLEENLADGFNTHAKIIRVTSFSKRWWNKEVAEARKTWAKAKKQWGTATPDRDKFKEARNLFYRAVRKAKRQGFLQGEEKKDGIDSIKGSAKDRCWIALKYTQPRQHHTTPALKGPNNEVAITLQAKEALVRAHAFPKPAGFSGREMRPAQGQE